MAQNSRVHPWEFQIGPTFPGSISGGQRIWILRSVLPSFHPNRAALAHTDYSPAHTHGLVHGLDVTETVHHGLWGF